MTARTLLELCSGFDLSRPKVAHSVLRSLLHFILSSYVTLEQIYCTKWLLVITNKYFVSVKDKLLLGLITLYKKLDSTHSS